MPAKPFIIEARRFARKQDARDFFQSMLRKYEPGDRVDDEDALHLSALLKHYTDYKDKIGAGIEYFGVMRNQYRTQSFQIVRIDGTSDDFSYKHCITPKKPNACHVSR
jgi:hypothetical protein